MYNLRYMKKYFLKYLPLFMIGIIANIVVDYVQLYIPEYLGDMVEIVSSKEGVIFADIKSIVMSLVIVSFVLLAGRTLMRFTLLAV